MASATPERARTVVVVQRRLTHYRTGFFDALREALAADGFALRLVVGEPTEAERSKGDGGQLDWAEPAPCRYLADGRLCWQDLRPWLANSGHLVLTQENKLLANWWLLPRQAARGRLPRVALWGHGRNRQASGALAHAAQRPKAWLSRRADWWFAYTRSSAEQVLADGVPADRITVLNNAVDTRALQQQVEGARALPRAELRRSLGVGSGPLALFIGSLYADKRLDLLLEAALRIRAAVPAFELVIAGAGPDAAAIEQRTAALPWVHRVGPVAGTRKAEWLTAADLMLNPGAVGLAVVESFAAALPLVVMRGALHGPEIDYLESGRNALITEPTVDAYADAVLATLSDEALAQRLRAGCRAAARVYTQESMVRRFRDGMAAWHGTSGREGHT